MNEKKPKISIEDILNELKNLPASNFFFSFCSDWYSAQDLESYVRVVAALRTPNSCSLPAFVAWVLQRDLTGPDFDPEVWLSNSELALVEPARVERLFQFIQPNPGQLDTTNLPYGWDEDIPQRPCIMPPNALEEVTSIYEIVGIHKGCNKRKYGPTYNYFWERDAWLFYIEEHLES